MNNLWFNLIILGIFFFLAEILFLSGDFFSLGIASILTGIILKILLSGTLNIPPNIYSYITTHVYIVAIIIWVISSILSWIITKYLVIKLLKNTKGKKINTTENIIGQHLIVQNINGEKVCYYEGIYRPIANQEEVDIGDQVEIIKFEDNKIYVKKI